MRAISMGALFVGVGVLILTAACGGREAKTDAYGERDLVAVDGTEVTVELKALHFAPQGIRIKPGTTVTWVNKDAAIHNVSQIESVFLSEDELKQGDTFSFTFDTPGTFRYQCTFHHPNMNGVVIVENV